MPPKPQSPRSAASNHRTVIRADRPSFHRGRRGRLMSALAFTMLLPVPAHTQTITGTYGTPTPNYNLNTSNLGQNVDVDALNSQIHTIATDITLSEQQKKDQIQAAVTSATNLPGATCAQQLDPIISGFSIASDATGIAGDIGEAVGAAGGVADFEIPGIVIQTVGDGLGLASDITSTIQTTMPNCNAEFTGSVLADANIVASQGVSAFNGAINLGNADGISYQGGIAIGGGSISGAGTPGHEARTDVASAIAIGNDAIATSDNSTALGEASSALAINTVALGANADAEAANSTAVGNQAAAFNTQATAIGSHAEANDQQSTAIGASSSASGVGSIALGAGAHANADGSVAIGQGSVADAANTVSVGNGVTQRRITNLAAGLDPTDAVNVSQLQAVQSAGDAALAITNQTVALLDARVVTNTTNITQIINGTAGQFQVNNTSNAAAPQASGQDSIAAGPGASALAAESVVIGNIASSTAVDTTVIGYNATATGPNSVVIGAHSSDGGLANVVSVGTTADPRQIINVADATNAHDAVNLSQLISTSNQTLLTANAYTDFRAAELGVDIRTVKNDADAATAAAMAVAAIPQTIERGKGVFGIGTGTWKGESAIAMGASMATNNGKFIFKIGGTYDTRGDFGGSAGAGIVF